MQYERGLGCECNTMREGGVCRESLLEMEGAYWESL